MLKNRFLLLAVLLASAACQDKVASDTGESSGKMPVYPEEITFYGVNDPRGKTVLNNEAILWESGDMIKVLWGDNRYTSAEARPYNSNVNAEFTANVEASSEYFGVYPYSASSSLGNSGLTVTVPAVQNGAFRDANITVAKADSENRMLFRHAVSYIEFTTDRTGVLEISGGSSNHLVGDITVTGFDAQGKPEYTVTGKGTSITVDVKASGTYCIAVLPDAKFDFVSLTLTEEGKEMYALSTNTITMTRGKLVGIGNITDRFKTERPLGATLESFKIEEFYFEDQNLNF